MADEQVQRVRVVPVNELSGKSRAKANIAALQVLRALRAEDREPTDDERTVLAKWGGWGALPGIFDEHHEWEREREELRSLLSEEEWEAAARSTLNAHYTSPDVAQAVWDAVQMAGFTGGRVLEPGCGAGVFMSLAPEGCEMVGVELDPVTAGIAQALHPGATVMAKPFEKCRLGEESFDLVIGNVPFGDYAPNDPAHNREGYSIHNYFMLKSLRLVRPGGLVALLTSRYTLDSKAAKHRAEIAELADPVAIVRLPSNSMQRCAGTAAVIDVLVYRRRSPGESPQQRNGFLDRRFLGSDRYHQPDYAWGNEWFKKRPSAVLGTVYFDRGMYSEAELMVKPHPGDLGVALANELGKQVAEAAEIGLTWAPRAEHVDLGGIERWDEATDLRKEGSVHPDGAGFVRIVGGHAESFPVKAGKAADELRAHCEMTALILRLLHQEAHGAPDSELDPLRAQLNEAYDGYVARFGLLNRCTITEREKDGEVILTRRTPAMPFKVDPDFHLLMSVEDFNDESQTATKRPIFSRRTVSYEARPERVETIGDAVALALDSGGSADPETVAALLGVGVENALVQLVGSGLVFDDPQMGRWVPAAQYLSGDVRSKLAVAEMFAADDPALQRNVEALQAVLPPWMGPAEINTRPGAPWTTPEHVEDFCKEVLGYSASVTREGAKWELGAGRHVRTSRTVKEWSASAVDAFRLIEWSLNQKVARVTPDPDKGLDHEKAAELTREAQQKQKALERRFAEWVWEDDARTNEICEVYNRRFNCHVAPQYDGSFLTFPGMSSAIELRPHQKDAIARVLFEGSACIPHKVGAGKTLVALGAAVKLRELGLASKPMLVVPNHTLDQAASNLRAAFPTARALVWSEEDAGADGRAKFVARCAAGDWDLVIIAHPSFTALGMPEEAVADQVDREIRRLRLRLTKAEGARTKATEKALARAEVRQAKLLAGKRDEHSIDFTMTGVDYLFIDESQEFKNLTIDANAVKLAGSKKASDLALKVDWLTERYGRSRCATLTGTPVANAVHELWVQVRFVNRPLLDSVGLSEFDAFAAAFGETVTRLEVRPDGGGWRLNSRFSKYVNVPEMMRLWRMVADVPAPEKLSFAVPELEGGKRTVVAVDPSTGLQRFVAGLIFRAANLRKTRHLSKGEDNMLAICTDGRKAALDLRLVGRNPDPRGGKIRAAALNIAEVYQAHRADTFPGSDRPGALQLVFCDMGTPQPHNSQVYGRLKAELVALGLPAEQVRFIHEANSSADKARLFRACREGRVSVLIGSTGKMGTGVNIQDRCVALHHLDAPWRPCDISQREGRMIRQGNLYSSVKAFVYITKGSFDAYMWQALETKSRFIEQVTSGQVDQRTIEEITGSEALSYAEIKSAASGSQLAQEKAQAEADVADLLIMRAAHARQQSRLRADARYARENLEQWTSHVRGLESAISMRDSSSHEWRGLFGVIDNPNGDVAERVRRWADGYKLRGAKASADSIGRYAGVDIKLHPDWLGQSFAWLTIGWMSTRYASKVYARELAKPEEVDWAKHAEELLAKLDEWLREGIDRAAHWKAELAALEAGIGEAWPDEHRLLVADAVLLDVETRIEAEAANNPETSEDDFADNPEWCAAFELEVLPALEAMLTEAAATPDEQLLSQSELVADLEMEPEPAKVPPAPATPRRRARTLVLPGLRARREIPEEPATLFDLVGAASGPAVMPRRARRHLARIKG